MNPADERLAIRTEDHPLEHADFEGVIVAGQDGASACAGQCAGAMVGRR
jgi:hypothetical protein